MSAGEKDPHIHAVVCCVDDLKDGDMKEVDVGDSKALLVRDNGEFYAVGAKCTHYGAPLAKGAYCNGVVRCPWHGACFNVKTGDIEDFPGLDSLPKFDVEISDNTVMIKTTKKSAEKARRQKPMVSMVDETKTYLLVGGGPAGLVCAETLRQEGYDGRIIIISKDAHLPYDRPKLSKAMSVTADQIALRDANFYSEHDIEVKLNTEVTSVNPTAKEVTTSDGEIMKFDKILLATGATPRSLTWVENHDLEDIKTLRSLDDANAIYDAAKDKNVVIVGTSFIGVEVAAALVDTAKSVTIVDLVEAPFQLALGKEIGEGVKKLLESKGVQFRFKTSAKEFVAENGRLQEVILQDDSRLEADVCVVGIGVVPATNFIKGSGLEMSDRGFVTVDKNMLTSAADVYAAGDIVEFPLMHMDNKTVNVQHWQIAHAQGKIAGLNMAGKSEQINSVPYFWTVIFGKSLRYTGYGVGYNDIIVHGDPEELKFVAYYTMDERVIAVASLNFDPIVSQAAEYFKAGKTLTKEEVKESPDAWVSKLCQS